MQWGNAYLSSSCPIIFPIAYTTHYSPSGTFRYDSAGFSLGFTDMQLTGMTGYAYNESKYFSWWTIGY